MARSTAFVVLAILATACCREHKHGRQQRGVLQRQTQTKTTEIVREVVHGAVVPKTVREVNSTISRVLEESWQGSRDTLIEEINRMCAEAIDKNLDWKGLVLNQKGLNYIRTKVKEILVYRSLEIATGAAGAAGANNVNDCLKTTLEQYKQVAKNLSHALDEIKTEKDGIKLITSTEAFDNAVWEKTWATMLWQMDWSKLATAELDGEKLFETDSDYQALKKRVETERSLNIPAAPVYSKDFRGVGARAMDMLLRLPDVHSTLHDRSEVETAKLTLKGILQNQLLINKETLEALRKYHGVEAPVDKCRDSPSDDDKEWHSVIQSACQLEEAVRNLLSKQNNEYNTQDNSVRSHDVSVSEKKEKIGQLKDIWCSTDDRRIEFSGQCPLEEEYKILEKLVLRVSKAGEAKKEEEEKKECEEQTNKVQEQAEIFYKKRNKESFDLLETAANNQIEACPPSKEGKDQDKGKGAEGEALKQADLLMQVMSNLPNVENKKGTITRQLSIDDVTKVIEVKKNEAKEKDARGKSSDINYICQQVEMLEAQAEAMVDDFMPRMKRALADSWAYCDADLHDADLHDACGQLAWWTRSAIEKMKELPWFTTATRQEGICPERKALEKWAALRKQACQLVQQAAQVPASKPCHKHKRRQVLELNTYVQYFGPYRNTLQVYVKLYHQASSLLKGIDELYGQQCDKVDSLQHFEDLEKLCEQKNVGEQNVVGREITTQGKQDAAKQKAYEKAQQAYIENKKREAVVEAGVKTAQKHVQELTCEETRKDWCEKTPLKKCEAGGCWVSGQHCVVEPEGAVNDPCNFKRGVCDCSGTCECKELQDCKSWFENDEGCAMVVQNSKFQDKQCSKFDPNLEEWKNAINCQEECCKK